MLEQILSYILVFLLGIIFAHRNSYLKIIERALYSMAENLEINLKNKTLNFKNRIDAYYYMSIKNLKDKDYSELRNNLRKIKYTVEEFIGE